MVLTMVAISGHIENDNNLDRLYVYGNYIDEVLYCRNIMTKGPNPPSTIWYMEHYYAHNHLFSVCALLNDTGTIAERYEYNAYGKATVWDATLANTRTTSSYSNPYYFTGRRLDELDSGDLAIMYYRNRYYNTETGRFLTHDPLSYADGMGLYEYVRGNPANHSDPSGLESNGICFGPGCPLVSDPWPELNCSHNNPWTTSDFLDHYCKCKSGDTVDLREIGLLDEFLNHYDVSEKIEFFKLGAILNASNEFDDLDCDQSKDIKFSSIIEPDVTFPCGSLFCIGNTRIQSSYHCRITRDCGDGCRECYRVQCNFSFSLHDEWFRDPLDVGLELPGCEPYAITASWRDRFRTTVCQG